MFGLGKKARLFKQPLRTPPIFFRAQHRPEGLQLLTAIDGRGHTIAFFSVDTPGSTTWISPCAYCTRFNHGRVSAIPSIIRRDGPEIRYGSPGAGDAGRDLPDKTTDRTELGGD